MFIAHLPTGYLASKALAPVLQKYTVNYKQLMFWGLLGAIAPDFDLLYFFLIDHQQHHHHLYFPHLPIVWLALFSLSLLWFRHDRQHGSLALIFSINGFIHLLLDSVVGDVWWLAPVIDKPYALFHIEALHQPWWLNFLLHWSFLLELIICLLALAVCYRQRRLRPATSNINTP